MKEFVTGKVEEKLRAKGSFSYHSTMKTFHRVLKLYGKSIVLCIWEQIETLHLSNRNEKAITLIMTPHIVLLGVLLLKCIGNSHMHAMVRFYTQCIAF